MSSFTRQLARARSDERGITGLETAIILIAFVVVATVFAFIVLTTGIFSAERGKETVYAGLAKARGTMEIRGGIVATASGAPLALETIEFTAATVAGGDAIPLDPSATLNKTVFAYRDNNVVAENVNYTIIWIVGDADSLLEPGEEAHISISVADIQAAITNGGTLAMAPNLRWTIEVQTPVGAVIDLTRSLPAAFDPVMQLH